MNSSRLIDYQQAALHLSQADPVMAQLVTVHGLCTIEPHQDYYRSLVDSIIGQQLSVKAAAAIKRRFRELFGGNFPEPAAILDQTVDTLRAVGLSFAKARYIQDLAQHVLDGKISFDKIDVQSNQEIIAELTDVKGIGEWTVHMFLMFCVGRLDILPIGDLGVRNAIRDRYELSLSPTPKAVTELALANQWHPYETVACWYLWESYDSEPFVP